MNISDYLEARTEETRAAKEELAEKKAEKRAKIEPLEKKKVALERSLKDLSSQNLDVTTIQKQLDEVVDDILRYNDLTDKPEEEYSRKSKALLAIGEFERICREKLGSLEIEEISDIAELHKYWKCTLSIQDGRPTGCRIWFSGHSHSGVELEIKNSLGRIMKALPSAISWIPSDWLPVEYPRIGPETEVNLHENETGDPEDVYYFSSTGEFRFFGNEGVSWHETKKVRDTWQTYEELVEKTFRFDDAANGLHSELLQQVDVGVLDLDTSVTHPVLQAVKDRIMELSILPDSGSYKRVERCEKSPAIAKVIADDFNLFVSAPWSGSMGILLSNFKYYCEQGENPRFFNQSVDGGYGFRLRTRDHSWLEGKCYIVPDYLPCEVSRETLEICVVESYSKNTQAVRIGRLILTVDSNTHDK